MESRYFWIPFLFREDLIVKFVLGIDAGGTKTQFTKFSMNGDGVGDIKLDAGNIVVDESEAIRVLHEGIKKSLLDDTDGCVGIVAGIAGIETSGRKKYVEKQLAVYNVPVTVISDAKLALANKLRGQDGMMLISGTGSVAYGLKNGRFFRVGGWGHILGDEGSAYAIALKCYKKVINDLDNSGELSDFSKAYLKYIEIEDPIKAINNVYNMDKGQIASGASFFASELSNVAGKDEIIDKTVQELSKAVFMLAKKMNIDRANIALTGSVLEKNDEIRIALLDKLNDVVDNVVINKEPNTKGAYYFYNNKE